MAFHKTYRVFVADDHQLFIDKTITALKTDNRIVIVGSAISGEETLLKIKDLEVDVLLLDISFPDRNGTGILESITKLKPGIKVIALTLDKEELFAKSVINRGAHNCLIKNIEKEELLNAIFQVNRDEDQSTTSISVPLKDQELPKEDYQLSQREIEVLQLISLGFTNAQIADKLNLSVHTTDSHRKNILKKLNVKNAAELVRVALKSGIIE